MEVKEENVFNRRLRRWRRLRALMEATVLRVSAALTFSFVMSSATASDLRGEESILMEQHPQVRGTPYYYHLIFYYDTEGKAGVIFLIFSTRISLGDTGRKTDLLYRFRTFYRLRILLLQPGFPIGGKRRRRGVGPFADGQKPARFYPRIIS